jgi:hypothetical protein
LAAFLVLRCSATGVLVGAIPGLGGTAAGFLSYMHAKQTCRNSETFGMGDVRGVIAPEAANDAKEGGSLLPTLAFGIPGSAGMAVFLGALTVHGVETGQAIFVKELGIVYMLLLAILGAHIIAATIGLAVAEKVALLTKVRPVLFAPILVFLIVMTLSSRMASWYGRFEKKALLPDEKMTSEERKKEISVLAWFVGGTILVYLVGFILSIPAFLFLFLKWRGKEKWMVSVLVPVVVTAVVYFVFMWGLSVPLYAGVVFE